MISKLKHAWTSWLSRYPRLDRLLRYGRPRQYWQNRGGQHYFEEQEAAADRTRRSEFLGGEIQKLEYAAFLEIGCGYGKQLQRAAKPGALVAGIDFSRPQLLKARSYLQGARCLAEADAERLPFRDKSFDAVFSSAVILHNDYEKARKILAEMMRLSRRYLIHNEDTDITFSRYGYDLQKTYAKMRLRIVTSCPIESAPDPSITQFTVAELPAPDFQVPPEQIPLQYHEK
ncbi:MAG TPA: class I SAM-dependent methyltransferase [Verrucomicrobiae bacterium]|jgi:SAM-dependent methyltransferase|nr:class I SAM-dependent methyltransferase [Verrucomicrobiae bacterium]